MGRWGLGVVIIALFATPFAGAQEATPQRFENPTAGIVVTRPAGWHTASLQTVEENRRRVELSDEELQTALQKAATAPLFVFMKYPEPHPRLNPSIQVTVRPSGAFAGSEPTEVLKVAVTALQKGFPDFTFVAGIESTEVAGRRAARLRAKYTLRHSEGQEFKVLTRLWLVPRGAFMFLIGMSGPEDGPDVSEKEFQETLSSLVIRN